MEHKTALLQVRVTKRQMAALKRVARRAKSDSLSAWARSVVLRAAGWRR